MKHNTYVKHEGVQKMHSYIGLAVNLMGFRLYAPYVAIYLSLLTVVGINIWYLMVSSKSLGTAKGWKA